MQENGAGSARPVEVFLYAGSCAARMPYGSPLALPFSSSDAFIVGVYRDGGAALDLLAEGSTWLTIEWLPKYAPAPDDIEQSWRNLKQHQFANHTAVGADDLDRATHDTVDRLNHGRHWAPPHPSASLTTAA